MCVPAGRSYRIDEALPGKARDFGIAVTVALLPVSSWDGADDLASVLSELANAALRSGTGRCTVRLVVHRGFIEATVRFARSGRAVPKADAGAQLSALIVGSLSLESGTRRINDHVEEWAIVACDETATRDIDCHEALHAG